MPANGMKQFPKIYLMCLLSENAERMKQMIMSEKTLTPSTKINNHYHKWSRYYEKVICMMIRKIYFLFELNPSRNYRFVY